MKALIAFTFTLMVLTAEVSQPTAPKELTRFERLMERPWQSFSLTMNLWLGDYWSHGPGVLLQKTPDGTVIVSWIGGPEANNLPIVIKTLPEAEGEALISKLSKIFRTGLGETAEVDKMTEAEVDAFIAKTHHTPSYFELVLRVAGLDTKTEEVTTKVDTSPKMIMKGASFEWETLVSTLRPEKPKGEQAGADQPATKPADKVPAKVKPSTPTPKDGPR
jgi:hypothetical protein